MVRYAASWGALRGMGSAAAYSLVLALGLAFSEGDDDLGSSSDAFWVVFAIALVWSLPVGAVGGALLGLLLVPLTRTRHPWIGPLVAAALLAGAFAATSLAVAGMRGAEVLIVFGVAPGAFAGLALLRHASMIIARNAAALREPGHAAV